MADNPDGDLGLEAPDFEKTRLDRALEATGKAFAWAIFAAFLISVFEVISRYVFDSPTYWAHESTSFLIAAVFLIGGPVALAGNKHIRVRMVYDAVGPKGRKILDIFSWNPPTPALLKIIILFCVIVMFVQSALHLIQVLRRDTREQR